MLWLIVHSSSQTQLGSIKVFKNNIILVMSRKKNKRKVFFMIIELRVCKLETTSLPTQKPFSKNHFIEENLPRRRQGWGIKIKVFDLFTQLGGAIYYDIVHLVTLKWHFSCKRNCLLPCKDKTSLMELFLTIIERL